MAQQPKDIKSTYPLPAYNFRVSLLQLPLPATAATKLSTLPGAQSVGFSEISGLQKQYESVTYRHGLSFLTGPTLLSGMEQEVKLSLKRGMIGKRDALYQWLLETQLPGGGKRDLLIDLCDEAGVPRVRWLVQGAMPTRLKAPDFSAETSQVAVEEIELVASNVLMEYFD